MQFVCVDLLRSTRVRYALLTKLVDAQSAPNPFARFLGERVENHHIQPIEIHAATDLAIVA